MENFNKKDLLFTIDKQTDEITRYKSRLRDVITAFKGLQSEKEAIEASFKAVTLASKSSPKPSDSREKNNGITEVADSCDLGATGELKQPLETTDNLKIQLSTLMNSLATLSAEKSRMEASFQADKKQLRSDKEERENKIKDLQDRLQNMTKQRLTDVETIKSRLIVERHDREKEQTVHAVMLRELQALISEERRGKQRLEQRLDEVRGQLSAAAGQGGQHELAARDLRNQLEAARGRLQRAESDADQTPAVLAGLQTEMCSLREQHRVALAAERARAARAEDAARRLAAANEQRVAGLESRLAELSDAVGRYDRLRQQDQLSIDKLKQRITQLDDGEGSQSDGAVDQSKERSDADLSNDVQLLVGKINQLKAELIHANARSEKPVDLSCALEEPPTSEHLACVERCQQLELRLQLLAMKPAPPPAASPEDKAWPAAADTQIRALKERNQALTKQLQAAQEECAERLARGEQEAAAERSGRRAEAAAAEAEHRRRAARLEQELVKQRERCTALVADKDQEIATLKSSFQMFVPGHGVVERDDVMASLSQLGQVLSGGGAGGGAGAGAGGGGVMLHYAHELSRRDVEISALRKAGHALECSFREQQREAARAQDQAAAAAAKMAAELARLQRCQSREGANLEYLKNVVLSFLLSADAGPKQHMLNAIAAVLRFSDEEMQRLHRAAPASSPASTQR